MMRYFRKYMRFATFMITWWTDNFAKGIYIQIHQYSVRFSYSLPKHLRDLQLYSMMDDDLSRNSVTDLVQNIETETSWLPFCRGHF